jgi:hypothetical protein
VQGLEFHLTSFIIMVLERRSRRYQGDGLIICLVRAITFLRFDHDFGASFNQFSVDIDISHATLHPA